MIPARARKWGHAKHAGFTSSITPMRTSYTEYSTSNNIAEMMQSHFPRRYARETILQDPNLSFQDRVRLMNAMDHAAAQSSPEKTTVQVSDWLPAAVGAGLGVVGAALTAPIFGFTPLQKKFYGIGAGALGAVLNTYGRD